MTAISQEQVLAALQRIAAPQGGNLVGNNMISGLVVRDGHVGFSIEVDPQAGASLEPLRKAREAIGPARAQAAEERGAAMSLATAVEYALMLTALGRPPEAAPPGLLRLSARERELITLVARGRTDAQIAELLFISVRTVRSHLDRIRDKTGCRRRADLTRIALQAHLV